MGGGGGGGRARSCERWCVCVWGGHAPTTTHNGVHVRAHTFATGTCMCGRLRTRARAHTHTISIPRTGTPARAHQWHASRGTPRAIDAQWPAATACRIRRCTQRAATHHSGAPHGERHSLAYDTQWRGARAYGQQRDLARAGMATSPTAASRFNRRRSAPTLHRGGWRTHPQMCVRTEACAPAQACTNVSARTRALSLSRV